MSVSDAFVSLYGKMIERGFTGLGKAAASFHTTLTAELKSEELLLAGSGKPRLSVQLSSASRPVLLFTHLLMDVTPCPWSRR